MLFVGHDVDLEGGGYGLTSDLLLRPIQDKNKVDELKI